MLIVLHPDADTAQQQAVWAMAQTCGLPIRQVPGSPCRFVVGGSQVLARWGERFDALPQVAHTKAIDVAYPLCSRAGQSDTTVVDVGGVRVGGKAVVMMAGPCAVESETQLMACAEAALAAGATILRGGAFKPRTNPYAFQGLGQQGLDLFAKVKRATGLRVVTEVVAIADIPRVADVADALQVGARNMQNFALLRALGQAGKPVLLKRGLCATYAEWLMAAEYIYAHGNPHIILCERGIRTYETTTRNTLDVAAVPVMRGLTHLPVVVDPSHGTGARDWVAPMARASIAAGADGLIIEAHPDPDNAWSDGPQSLTLPMLHALAQSLAPIAQAVGRTYTPEAAHG